MPRISCPRCLGPCHTEPYLNGCTDVWCSCGWGLTQYGELRTEEAALERWLSMRSGRCEQMQDPMER